MAKKNITELTAAQTKPKSHIIFKTFKEADEAQQSVFNRLKSQMDIHESTTAWDMVLEYKEGYGFASPRNSSLYDQYASFVLKGFEDNEMNATRIIDEG